jgi:hypothetical protein
LLRSLRTAAVIDGIAVIDSTVVDAGGVVTTTPALSPTPPTSTPAVWRAFV